MRNVEFIPEKIKTAEQLTKFIASERIKGKTFVFTNGCFDILHEGHIYSLSAAAKEADFLIVGLNSDSSVKQLKGDARPVNSEQSRAMVLAALLVVDAVIIFEETTPEKLLQLVRPDVYVKGGDYTKEQLAGYEIVESYGGKIIIHPFLNGFSTTSTIQKLSDMKKEQPFN